MFVLFEGAQAAAATSSSGGNSLMEAFKENPTFLSINLVVSAIVVAMIVERAIFQLTKYRVNSKEFFAQIKKLVTAGNIDRAIKLCDAGDYPTLQLVKAGLTHANKGPDEIDAAMSEKMGELKPAVEKRIGSLWSLANIATLLGLLGTVTGIIRAFNAIQAGGMGDPRALSGGIAEALIATAAGLCVAIPALISYRYLRGRVEGIVMEMEKHAIRMADSLESAQGRGHSVPAA